MNELFPPIGWALAFGAGVASFFSPCAAPLIPGYLSPDPGVACDELAAGGRAHTRRVLRASLLFVLGFVPIFILLDVAAWRVGRPIGPHRRLVNRAGGVVMIAMGLLVLGIVRIPSLARGRIHLSG